MQLKFVHEGRCQSLTLTTPGQFSCLYFTRVCRSARNAISAPTQGKGLTREDSLHGRSQDFPLGGGVIVFIENCSLLVNRLGRISECYIEVEQKKGEPGSLPPPPSPLAAPLVFIGSMDNHFCYILRAEYV